MDVAVGVGRAVMEDEQGPVRRSLLELLVQLLPVPAFQILRLLLGQAGLHVEPGLGQVQSVPVIHFLSRMWLFVQACPGGRRRPEAKLRDFTLTAARCKGKGAVSEKAAGRTMPRTLSVLLFSS